MKKYIQVREGYITDCITYPYGDYIEIETKENINISGFQTYKDGIIGIDEKKKLEIYKDIEDVIEPELSLKDQMIKQLKDIEERGIKKRAEYFAAEMIKDEALRKVKVAKIVAEGQEIADEYQAIVNLLKNDFGLDLSEII